MTILSSDDKNAFSPEWGRNILVTYQSIKRLSYFSMIELSMLGFSLPTDPDSVTMDVVALQAKAKHKEAS